MLKELERVLAALTWFSVPAYLVWIAFLARTSWRDHSLFTVGLIALTLFLGTVPAWLIFSQSKTGSGARLAVMWLLVVLLGLMVLVFAFTWIGSAAFFWGLGTLLAAIVGSIDQVTGRHAPRGGGRRTVGA